MRYPLILVLALAGCSDFSDGAITGAEAQRAIELCLPNGGLAKVYGTSRGESCGYKCSKTVPHELKVRCESGMEITTQRARRAS